MPVHLSCQYDVAYLMMCLGWGAYLDYVDGESATSADRWSDYCTGKDGDKVDPVLLRELPGSLLRLRLQHKAVYEQTVM